MAPTEAPNTTLSLAELVTALAAVLSERYPGSGSGRVRDLPDARTVRWYQTLGIVDRPALYRGRTALYGRRHVVQLAAIKRLQAAGFPLADIQRGLAGHTDAELAHRAGVALAEVDEVVEAVAQARLAAAAERITAMSAEAAPSMSRRSTAFWKTTPADCAPAAALPVAPAAPTNLWATDLGGGAMLLWNGRELTGAERARLNELAEPLVAFLVTCNGGAAAERACGAVSDAARPEQGAH